MSQNAWIPEGGGVYERMAADGFVYTFPPSALVSGSPLGLLAGIDDRFYHLTGNYPNWSESAPGNLWSALPALETNDATQLGRPSSPNSETPGSSATTAGRLPRFANEDLLTEHFLDHGTDFGAKSEADYEAQAGQFLTAQGNPDIQEKMNYERNIVRFNPKTNEFAILSPSGLIRTYYVFDLLYPANQNYFDGQ